MMTLRELRQQSKKTAAQVAEGGFCMIESSLSVLMAKNGYRTIKRVSAETGISRTTLTTLYYNKGKGIDFSTLEKLCRLFRCDVGDILYIKRN